MFGVDGRSGSYRHIHPRYNAGIVVKAHRAGFKRIDGSDAGRIIIEKSATVQVESAVYRGRGI